MGCDCADVSVTTDAERATLRTALFLNATMFVIGSGAGIWAQSTGMLAGALDMLTDAIAYGLALMAISRGLTFKKNAARWSGTILVLLGVGIVVEVVRRWFYGSEPVGLIMVIYSIVSLAVNLYVLKSLAQHRSGEGHMRASYICTRADVCANIAVLASGVLVMTTGIKAIDLVVGFGIGSYVLKEAVEILREAKHVPSAI